MRVVCIHVPRSGQSDASAIQETAWDLFPARTFWHLLDNIVESIWEPFSLELYVANNMIYLCIAGSDQMLDILTNGIYSCVSDAEVRDVDDYTGQISKSTLAVGAQMKLWRPDIYPLKDYRAIPSDTMSLLAGPLSNMTGTDRLIYQVVVKPLKDNTPLQVELALRRSQEMFVRKLRSHSWFKRDLPTDSVNLMKTKCSGNLALVSLRVAALSELPPQVSKEERRATYERLTERVRGVWDALKAFNTQDENRIVMGPIQSGGTLVRRLQERRLEKPYKLSTVEIATLFHLPQSSSLPNTAIVVSRKGPPPCNLPTAQSDGSVSTFGTVNYRDLSTRFGIKRFDRRRHLYVVGKSGSGKSCLLQLLAQRDMETGLGCAVIDPHGDLVDDILKIVPRHRVKDVVFFDPSDTKFPVGFNPMYSVRPELRLRTTISFLDAFKRIFGGEWSQKMEHVLRYAILGLLGVPDSNLISLRRMLSDDRFRGEVVRSIKDESVKRFWVRDFMAHRQEFEEGPIARLLNRLDELLANKNICNILGQATKSLDFRSFMDAGKIVLMKVSKGVLGAECSTLFGTLLIWKIYEAAMSRSDLPPAKRRDFYLYVDEFQNFATDSFAEILTESRKYNLSLTFANQHLSQLPQSISRAILGNVGNILSFRVGADDASALGQEFRPKFGEEDLLNLPLREFYLKMSIDGQVQDAFSGRTMEVRRNTAEHHAEECVAYSRQAYSKIAREIYPSMKVPVMFPHYLRNS